MKLWVVKEVAQKRYDECKKCDLFNHTLGTCKECGCVMKLKVKLANTSCPLSKWGPHQ